MSYVVLARKWRPQSFEDLVGQEHVSTTIGNAIAQNRVAHAFLFTGVRGVGKTTSARILAKALNCVNGPTATPCQKCPQCLEITNGSDVDVQEIDGASYNGIDEVRRLQETLPYRPQRDRFKIFIVDEVHMLSNAAWNAFLKTLEEPPPHVKFIFATTEVHKVPVTILSRCQRYDFKLIGAQTVAARLRYVLEKENIAAEDGAVKIIAREAAGSMRDAMSLLDQVIAWVGVESDKLTAEGVAKVLGVAERVVLHRLAEAVLTGDAATCVRIISELAQQGYDLPHTARDFLAHLRDLVIAKVSDDAGSLLDLADEELADVKALAARSDVDDLTRLHQGFSRSFDDIVRSGQPRASLEMALVRLARRPPLLPVDELLRRLSDLERRLGGGAPGPSGGAPRGGAPGPGGPPAGRPGGRPGAMADAPDAPPAQAPAHAAPAPAFTPPAAPAFAAPAPAFTPPPAPAFTPPPAPAFSPPATPAFAAPAAPAARPTAPQSPAFTPPQAPAFTPPPAPAFAAPAFAAPAAPAARPAAPQAPAFTPPHTPAFTPPQAPAFTPPQAPAFTPPPAPAFAAPAPAARPAAPPSPPPPRPQPSASFGSSSFTPPDAPFSAPAAPARPSSPPPPTTRPVSSPFASAASTSASNAVIAAAPADLGAWRAVLAMVRAKRPALASVLEHAALLQFAADRVVLGYETGSFLVGQATDAAAKENPPRRAHPSLRSRARARLRDDPRPQRQRHRRHGRHRRAQAQARRRQARRRRAPARHRRHRVARRRARRTCAWPKPRRSPLHDGMARARRTEPCVPASRASGRRSPGARRHHGEARATQQATVSVQEVMVSVGGRRSRRRRWGSVSTTRRS
ncbi:MAG: DNA polymerase III subunit gamma/tau [Minicystis sp.]